MHQQQIGGRNVQPEAATGSSSVIGVPVEATPGIPYPSVQIAIGPTLRSVPCANLSTEMCRMPSPVFADVMRHLGWIEELPHQFRDLTLEFELCQLGHGPRPARIPVRSHRSRFRFDSEATARHSGAAREVSDELERKDLKGIYELVELPFVRLGWKMARMGPLIATDRLANQDCGHFDVAKRVVRSVDLLTNRLRLPLAWSSTGRVYTRGGYLQNLPRPLRKAVVAPPGCVLMEIDYRHMDLVMLAALSQDKELLSAVRGGSDLHLLTAELIACGGTPDRNKGKLFNFIVLYGAADRTVAELLGVSVSQAQAMRQRFWSGLPEAAQWRKYIQEQAAGRPHTLRNPFNRLGWFPPLDHSMCELARRRRRAVSFMCQSSAADVFKRALLRLIPRLDEEVKLVLTLHDSILLEVPESKLEHTGTTAREALQVQLPELNVPLRVDISVGRNWGSMNAVGFSK